MLKTKIPKMLIKVFVHGSADLGRSRFVSICWDSRQPAGIKSLGSQCINHQLQNEATIGDIFSKFSTSSLFKTELCNTLLTCRQQELLSYLHIFKTIPMFYMYEAIIVNKIVMKVMQTKNA